MRIKGAKQVHYEAGPNMTPLVDVVMVILIFLMLAGSFGGAEHYLESKTPIRKNAGGEVKDAPVPDETDFRIVVDPNGDRFSARPDGMDVIQDKDQLTAALEQRLGQFTATGTPVDKVQVVISPSRQIKYAYLIDVYQAALDAKFTKVAFEEPHD